MTRYGWIDSQKADGFPVRAACGAAEVAPSAYYDWKARHVDGPTWAEAAEAYLVAKIRQIWEESDRTYGEPRVTAELARQGWKENTSGWNG